jgi:hypothetical protein
MEYGLKMEGRDADQGLGSRLLRSPGSDVAKTGLSEGGLVHINSVYQELCPGVLRSR